MQPDSPLVRDFLGLLRPFVRFPSVSVGGTKAQATAACARWLADLLHRTGLDGRVFPTTGAPLVYAEWRRAAGMPTVLVYGHYDVQPVEPLHAWKSPPFEAVVRGSRVYGRGTSDDKGPILILVKALEGHLRRRGRLPVNVVCLFEGEEESGSAGTQAFVRAHPDLFAADVAVLSDSKMLASDRPAVTYAERGALSFEVEMQGPPTELHSGTYGGAVHNPLHALSDLVASMHGSDDRVAIPGFYEGVRDVPAADPHARSAGGAFDAAMMRQIGGIPTWGDSDYTLYERTTSLPALSVTGMSGGHQGPGVKSVIPPRALAKINIRLVAEQDPARVERAFRDHVREHTPRTVRSTVRTMLRARPAVVDPGHPAMQAAARAYRHGFGRAPVFLRSGGTIPLVATFLESLHIPTILMGFSLAEDRIHAPNESFYLPTVPRAVATAARFLEEIAAVRSLPRVGNGAKGAS